jgi:hypothetical protein
VNRRTGTSSSYKGVSKSNRTGHLEIELQMVQLSATRCSCIAILSVSLVNFAAITLCAASQRVCVVVVVVVVVVNFVIDSVRNLLDIPSYNGRRRIRKRKALTVAVKPAYVWYDIYRY